MSSSGIENGYMGLSEPDLARPLTRGGHARHPAQGRHHPRHLEQGQPVPLRGEGGRQAGWRRTCRTWRCAAARSCKLDGLIAVGGDGTLSIAPPAGGAGAEGRRLPEDHRQRSRPAPTRRSASTPRALICTEAVDRLHTTAESHDRVMVLEMMGRHAGFLALESGIAGGADVILIPEIPTGWSRSWRSCSAAATRRAQLLHHRHLRRRVSRRAARCPSLEKAEDDPRARRGAAGRLRQGARGPAGAHIEAEIRVTVLGHLQRGGGPTAADRVLGHPLRLQGAGPGAGRPVGPHGGAAGQRRSSPCRWPSRARSDGWTPGGAGAVRQEHGHRLRGLSGVTRSRHDARRPPHRSLPHPRGAGLRGHERRLQGPGHRAGSRGGGEGAAPAPGRQGRVAPAAGARGQGGGASCTTPTSSRCSTSPRRERAGRVHRHRVHPRPDAARQFVDDEPR